MLSMGVTVQLLIANGISFHIVDIYGELRPQFQHVFNVFIPIGIIGALSGPLLGYLCDAISMKYGLLTLQALQLAILSSFFIIHERWSFGVFAISMGMSWCLYGILLTTSWSRFVAKSYQGRTLGWVYAQTMLGSAAGPWLFSVSRLLWDSYRPVMQYLILGIVTMMAMTITFAKKETLAPKT
jgi:MFS family permease